MQSNPLPILSSEEIRVLGSLMEKSRTTPDYYPMTLNGLTIACNQKSSRKPVVEYSEEEVMNAIKSLRAKGLVATETGGTNRTMKYRHSISAAFDLNPASISILCLLFLRGPLTPGEINSNSNRLYDFESLDEVLKELDALQNAEHPFVQLLPKQAGQKEARYIHLFSDIDIQNYVDDHHQPTNPSTNQQIGPVGSPTSTLEIRIENLEIELATLKEQFEKLMKELNG